MPFAIRWVHVNHCSITEDFMGKYFIAWLLGIPASLLVLIYLFTHIF